MVDLAPFFKDLNSLIGIVQTTITILLTELAKRKITLSETALVNFKQLASWIISISLSLIGFFFKFGMFAELSLLVSIVYGFVLGLAANGVFDIKLINSLFTKKEIK